MIRTFPELLDKVRSGPKLTIAVAAAEDRDVLSSVRMALDEGILSGAFLVGDQEAIERIANEAGIDISPFTVVHAEDKVAAAREAIRLVREGEAHLPMKGFVDTPIILKALLDKENGLRTGGLISHVGVLQVAGFDRMFLLSDSAMTIAPTLENKVDLIRSCVQVAKSLDMEMPKVAILSAVEKVSEHMQSTIDGEELTRMNEAGEIQDCLVKGPLSLDLAVSPDAAKHKKMDHPVAGHADVLIVPNIESGNILNKSMEYFAHAEKAGVIMGAKKPLILTSRASSDRSKMNSIALAILVTQAMMGEGHA